jgi:hypothetical protein
MGSERNGRDGSGEDWRGLERIGMGFFSKRRL